MKVGVDILPIPLSLSSLSLPHSWIAELLQFRFRWDLNSVLGLIWDDIA